MTGEQVRRLIERARSPVVMVMLGARRARLVAFFVRVEGEARPIERVGVRVDGSARVTWHALTEIEPVLALVR